MRNLTRRETEAIFEQLDAFGWITRTPGFRPSDPPHWIVNPAVHQKYTERGKAEAERRERDRKMIGEILRSKPLVPTEPGFRYQVAIASVSRVTSPTLVAG